MNLPAWAKNLPWPEIYEITEEFGIEPRLVAAIIQKESGGVPLRTRMEGKWDTDLKTMTVTSRYLFEPERFATKLGISKATEVAQQRMSWGLMQVMGSTARGEGFDDHLPILLEPSNGIYWGCVVLKTKMKKYESLKAVISSYNAGSVRYLPTGPTLTFTNQKYVDGVLSLMAELG